MRQSTYPNRSFRYSVLHLSEVERETGQGVDRDDLITWYLEQKESQFESVAELEHEKELIGKALTKLAKVCFRERHAGRDCNADSPPALLGQVPSRTARRTGSGFAGAFPVGSS